MCQVSRPADRQHFRVESVGDLSFQVVSIHMIELVTDLPSTGERLHVNTTDVDTLSDYNPLGENREGSFSSSSFIFLSCEFDTIIPHLSSMLDSMTLLYSLNKYIHISIPSLPSLSQSLQLEGYRCRRHDSQHHVNRGHRLGRAVLGVGWSKNNKNLIPLLTNKYQR